MSLHSDVGYTTGLYRVTRRSAGARVDGHYVHPNDFSASATLINPLTDEIEILSHGLTTGAGPLWPSTTNELPLGLLATAEVWVIRLTDDVIQLALTRADALDGIPIDLTTAGTGTLTLSNVFLISADVQPASGRELEDLRQGQMAHDLRTLWTDSELKPRTSDYEPDSIEIDGDTFRVKNVKYYGVISGHYVVTVERETTP